MVNKISFDIRQVICRCKKTIYTIKKTLMVMKLTVDIFTKIQYTINNKHIAESP